MKTFLDYLIEGKVDDEYNKNFSSIDREVFNTIVKMDPKTQVVNDEITSIGFGSKQLLLPKYMSGETDFTQKGEEITKALTDYYPNIAKYPKFNEFKSVADFLTFMANPESANIEKVEKENPIDTIYNKYYSDINREDFNKIISLDSGTTDDKVGEIAKFLLLPKFKAGENSFLSKGDKVKRACELYYKDKNKLPAEKQQISTYGSVDEFVDYILSGPESALVARLKNDTTVDPRTHRQVKDDFRLVASTPEYDILEPKSHRAAYAISGGWSSADGMHWCTGWEPTHGSENDNYYRQYTDGGGRLFCFMHKTRNRGTENRPINWQIQVKGGQVREFLNGHDSKAFEGNSKEEQFTNFLMAYPDICLAIKDKEPFSSLVAVSNAADKLKYSSEPFTVNTQADVSKLLRTDYSAVIKEAHINIEVIPTALFAGYNGLKKVVFGPNVKAIGAQAFKNCPVLSEIEFPESLEIIGAEAFATCTELKGSIKIPNSVKEIRTRAFANDHCKLKIDKARTTKIKFDILDRTWVNSHVQGIKVQ